MKSHDEIPVGILSAPRDQDTLSRTIQSLIASGFSRIYVHYDRQNKGLWPAYQQLMSEVVCLFGEKPILLTEDDIVLCQGVHDAICCQLSTFLQPDVGLISLYTSGWTRHSQFPKYEFGLNEVLEYRVESLCGALAYLWNPKALREIVVADDLPRDDPLGTDIHIPRWLERHGYRSYHHLPSLVQHTGQSCSTYENTTPLFTREADTFVGEEYGIDIPRH